MDTPLFANSPAARSDSRPSSNVACAFTATVGAEPTVPDITQSAPASHRTATGDQRRALGRGRPMVTESGTVNGARVAPLQNLELVPHPDPVAVMVGVFGTAECSIGSPS